MTVLLLISFKEDILDLFLNKLEGLWALKTRS